MQNVVLKTRWESDVMEKQNIMSILKNLNSNQKIKLEDIPDLDLYMDQVIQLFENNLSGTKRNDDDKVLTKTMINNYAKAKLLMSIKNKKYTKEHLILMSLIYELKGGLSINDIKYLLTNIVSKYENNDEYDLRKLYELFLEINKYDCEEFKKSVEKKVDVLKEKFKDNSGDEDYDEKFLLISSMISMSNMYRRMGEALIDEYFLGSDK